MTIQDYNHPDCLHGFPEWTERQLDEVLSIIGCPSCQTERIAELQAKVEAQERVLTKISPCFKHALKFPKENECTWCQIESLQAKVEELSGELRLSRNNFDELATIADSHLAKVEALEGELESMKAMYRLAVRGEKG